MTFIVPAEWAPHRAMWLGFPSHADLWEDDLDPAQAEVAALARALAGPGRRAGAADDRLRRRRGGRAARCWASVAGIEIVPGRFGDIWLRDTGPIFADGRAHGFRFNGWGGKYELEHDDTVAAQIAAAAGAPLVANDFILEGGAVDHDGIGTVLTTGQCLLNRNRNPGWTEAAAAEALGKALGARKVLWLGEGLRQRPHRRPRRQPGPLRRARRRWPSPWPGAAAIRTPTAFDDAARRLAADDRRRRRRR